MRFAPATALALLPLLLGTPRDAAAQTGVPAGYASERGLDRDAVLLTGWRPTAPQECVVAKAPAVLPAADSILAVPDMPFLLKQGGLADTRGYALFSIRYDSLGAVERLGIIERNLSDSAAASLTQVLLAGLQSQRPGAPWGVRLRIDLDSVPRYRVGRSERCLAAALPLEAGGPNTDRVEVVGVVVRGGNSIPAATPTRVQTRRETVRFAVVVNERGEVIDAKPVSGTTISASVVDPMRANLLRQRWLPELDDGVAVPTVVEVRQERYGVLAPAP